MKMPSNINHVTLAGRLTRDPELRTTTGGMEVLTFSLAVNSRQKGQDGQWGDKAGFFDVKMFGARAGKLAGYLAKGAKVAVSGRLDWQSWEGRDGKRHTKVEVIADELELMDGGGRGQQQAQAQTVYPSDDDLLPYDLPF